MVDAFEGCTGSVRVSHSLGMNPAVPRFMSLPVGSFHLEIDRVHDYEFRVRFDRPGSEMTVDEPPPLGGDAGPNPARLLAAAVGTCLSASLVYCLSRAKVSVRDLKAEVAVELTRNERKRLRVGKVAVALHPLVDDPSAVASCLEAYEDFCVVTQSVREGLPVEVSVDVQSPAPK